MILNLLKFLLPIFLFFLASYCTRKILALLIRMINKSEKNRFFYKLFIFCLKIAVTNFISYMLIPALVIGGVFYYMGLNFNVSFKTSFIIGSFFLSLRIWIYMFSLRLSTNINRLRKNIK